LLTSVHHRRNRKVRGLRRRGNRLYLQTRVAGETSARKIPLKATTLEDAKTEVAEKRRKEDDERLLSTGVRPTFADYCRRFLKFRETMKDAGRKPRTVARERQQYRCAQT
jgi:sRNA-binding protein